MQVAARVIVVCGFISALEACSPSRKDVCAPGNDIHLSVGTATYVVRDEDLAFVSPSAPSGLVDHSGRNSDGKVVRYCRRKGHPIPRVDSFGLEVAGNRREPSGEIRKILAQIISSNGLSSSVKPTWPYASSKSIEQSAMARL